MGLTRILRRRAMQVSSFLVYPHDATPFSSRLQLSAKEDPQSVVCISLSSGSAASNSLPSDSLFPAARRDHRTLPGFFKSLRRGRLLTELPPVQRMHIPVEQLPSGRYLAARKAQC